VGKNCRGEDFYLTPFSALLSGDAVRIRKFSRSESSTVPVTPPQASGFLAALLL
jgi:hypothetical protein